jgi:ATP-dependent Clp protease adapter protein ClpS
MTIIFNDDHTPIDLVVLTVIAATKCSVEEAEIETWEAHHYGKAPIHFSSESECDQVARVLQSIGVKTEVVPEWTE